MCYGFVAKLYWMRCWYTCTTVCLSQADLEARQAFEVYKRLGNCVFFFLSFAVTAHLSKVKPIISVCFCENIAATLLQLASVFLHSYIVHVSIGLCA